MSLSAIVQWVNTETGLLTFWENQNEFTPPEDVNYISLHLEDRDKLGLPNENTRVIDEQAGTVSTEISYDTVIGIQFRCKEDRFGDILEGLQLSLDKESVQDLLSSANLAIKDCGKIISRPTNHNELWENQSVMLIVFNSAVSIEDNRSYIESAPVTTGELS